VVGRILGEGSDGESSVACCGSGDLEDVVKCYHCGKKLGKEWLETLEGILICSKHCLDAVPTEARVSYQSGWGLTHEQERRVREIVSEEIHKQLLAKPTREQYAEMWAAIGRKDPGSWTKEPWFQEKLTADHGMPASGDWPTLHDPKQCEGCAEWVKEHSQQAEEWDCQP